MRGLVGKENAEALPDVVGDESMSVRALTLPNVGKEIYLVVSRDGVILQEYGEGY